MSITRKGTHTKEAYRNLMTRDPGGNRDPGRRWDPVPEIFSDLKFEFLKNEKCFSKLDISSHFPRYAYLFYKKLLIRNSKSELSNF